ncbi:hypothetical protein Tco_0556303, partial [Tanacetum coccineum]
MLESSPVHHLHNESVLVDIPLVDEWNNPYIIRCIKCKKLIQASSFVSPPSCDRNRGGFNDYDSEVGSVFEEEFIGPTLVVQNTIGIPSFEQQPLNTEDEKTKPVHCPSTSPRVSRSVNIGSTNSFFEETTNVSLSLGQGYADDSVGPSIEVNSNLVPNGPP